MNPLRTLIILILAFAAMIYVLRSKNPEHSETAGKARIAGAINAELKNGLNGRMLQNVCVQSEADGASGNLEIDVLLISTKGIFVFDSRDHTGYIFGDEEHEKWTVSLYARKSWGGYKHSETLQFDNPIWENEANIRALRDLLDGCVEPSVPVCSAVVFPDRSQFKSVSYDQEKVTVMKANQLKSYLRNIRETHADAISPEAVDSIAERLS